MENTVVIKIMDTPMDVTGIVEEGVFHVHNVRVGEVDITDMLLELGCEMEKISVLAYEEYTLRQAQGTKNK